MDGLEFWWLIEQSRRGCEDGDTEQQAKQLETLLQGRSREDLSGFEVFYRRQLDRAYRYDLWGAGYILMGAMEEEDFDYFMDWLISRGQDVFERALEDPQSLADVEIGPMDAFDAEELRYAVYAAYRTTHGDDLPVSWTGPDREAGPAGEPWDPADLPRLFPRLRTVED